MISRGLLHLEPAAVVRLLPKHGRDILATIRNGRSKSPKRRRRLKGCDGSTGSTAAAVPMSVVLRALRGSRDAHLIATPRKMHRAMLGAVFALLFSLMYVLVPDASLGSMPLTPWTAFLRQPVIPGANPSVIDSLPPPAVASASAALLQVDVADSAQLADRSKIFYRAHVSKILFAHRSVPSNVLIQTGFELVIPAGRYAVAVTPISSSSALNDTAYRLTWRVIGIGVIERNVVTFRSSRRPNYSYRTDDPHSWIGCFYRSVASRCRDALLARYRITSSSQKRVFEELIVQNPFAGLVWAQVARSTSHRFPSVLCSSSVFDNCASLDAFERMIDYRPSN
ncbi:MAG: hypothetical protein JWO85_2907 [Candidatus Eremiobacteraeota bacterium]|nr:hypothetical protein [Candidatus Eremiobacteraeota bacterium]